MSRINLKKINESLSDFLSILSKLAVTTLVILVLILFIGISKRGGYGIGGIEVPSSFESDGISGPVVARLLVDEITRIENGAYYKLSEIHEQELVGEEKPISGALSFAGVEFQIEDLIRYLGIDKRKIINGELLISGNVLRLNVRVPGEGMNTFKTTFDNVDDLASRNVALDTLISEAGEFLVEKTNPMVLAYYYYSQLTDEGIARAIDISNDVIESNHGDAKIAHYLIADRNYFHYADTRKSLEHINKALAIDGRFSVAWFFRGFIMLHPHGVEIDGQPLQTIEEIYGNMDEEERLEQAIISYETGLKYQPKDFFALVDLAEIYIVEKENPTNDDVKKAEEYLGRAKKVYEEYFELNPIMDEASGQKRLEKLQTIIESLRK